jgi:hypothetical protein
VLFPTSFVDRLNLVKEDYIRCYTDLILVLLSGTETPLPAGQLLVNDFYFIFLINTVDFSDILWYI